MKHEDNERLVRVGRGTPTGELFRRYWLPALLSLELPGPDCPPVRVRLLGEDLIAFRDSFGEVGLVDSLCPHRLAPLFFAVNAEGGLRCPYHGLKFNRNGDCIDLPCEPPGSPAQAEIKLGAYPTHEAGDIVWTYMGPPDRMPDPPDYEWLRVPATHRYVSKTYEDCNYLQGLEGGLDTAHVSFLHSQGGVAVTKLSAMDPTPKLEVNVTDYGYCYISRRLLKPDRAYIRLYQYIMPTQQMRPSVVDTTGALQPVPTIDGHLWAPIDDESTNVYNYMYSYDRNYPLSADFICKAERRFGRAEDDLIPGTFRLKRNMSNDYLVDREAQKKGNLSGIVGVNTQDYALQEGMGRIVDRTKEYLLSTDRAIVVMRRLMLEATRAVEQGHAPRGCNPSDHRNARPHDDIVPPGGTEERRLLDKTVARF